MNIANKITYFATDEQRQIIPWVQAWKTAKGKVTEYITKDNPPTQEQIDKADKRRMDCIDCHNRPTHIYVAAGSLGRPRHGAGTSSIPRLPFIKQQGVEVLTADYKTTEEAQTGHRREDPQVLSATSIRRSLPAKADKHQRRSRGTAAHLRHHVLSRR